MKTFFRNNNSDELILFFCGWGMDEKPYLPLKSSADILFFYDYTDLKLDLNLDLLKYKKTTLIAFSYGVFMAALLKDLLPECDFKIAVNGTLKPVDEEFGIPQKIFMLTLENMTANTAYKFREKLFDNEDHLFAFNQNLPVRDIDNSLAELSALKNYFFENMEVDFGYDKVLIGNSDKVIPVKNQKNYWQFHKNLHLIDGGHFLFYNFADFDEMAL